MIQQERDREANKTKEKFDFYLDEKKQEISELKNQLKEKEQTIE